MSSKFYNETLNPKITSRMIEEQSNNILYFSHIRNLRIRKRTWNSVSLSKTTAMRKVMLSLPFQHRISKTTTWGDGNNKVPHSSRVEMMNNG